MEVRHDASHTVTVFVLYTDKTSNQFSWKGQKPAASNHKFCHTIGTFELGFVEAVWIRQTNSSNEWAAEAVTFQDYDGKSTYALAPPQTTFWTDGYGFVIIL